MLGSPRVHFKKPGDALGCIGGPFQGRALPPAPAHTALCAFYSNAIHLRHISASLGAEGVRRHSSCDDATQELELDFWEARGAETGWLGSVFDSSAGVYCGGRIVEPIAEGLMV